MGRGSEQYLDEEVSSAGVGWSSQTDLAALAGQWSPDAIVAIDPDCRVRYASRSIVRILGFDRSFELGAAMFDFVHPDDQVTATGALNAASRSTTYQHPVEFRIRHADGDWIDCEVNGQAVSGPGGAWVLLSIRPARDRDEVIGRRRHIEQLIRMASLECSTVRWDEVDRLVEHFLKDLAGIVGAEQVELAWEDEADAELLVHARWPSVRRSIVGGRGQDLAPFVPLWPLEESAAMLLRFTEDLESLEPSPARDRFVGLGTRAVVEVPLSARAPWSVVRLAFGEPPTRWDDANVDLVVVLVTTLMATLRRCLAEGNLQRRARTDSLTGLLNRSELYRRFEGLLAARDHRGARAGDAETDAGLIGVLYCDLDLFKEINDRFGHAAGDEVLVDVADALRASVRDQDLVARFGGDEFVVVCPQVASREALQVIVGRITQAVGGVGFRGLPVEMSIGAAVADDCAGVDDAIRLADEAMYRAKRGRDR